MFLLLGTLLPSAEAGVSPEGIRRPRPRPLPGGGGPGAGGGRNQPWCYHPETDGNTQGWEYPKDDTPGCTLESKDFSKLNSMINKKNTVVFGISKDSIESHLKFKKKYKLKFDLLSDEKLSVIKKYGAWGMKSFLGKKYKRNFNQYQIFKK